MLAGFVATAVRETGSKDTRAEPLASQLEAGNVHLLRADWNESFINELSNFPMGHDDQVDAASGAFAFLAQSRAPMNITDESLRELEVATLSDPDDDDDFGDFDMNDGGGLYN